jgi:hypothetical protein
VPPPTTRPVRGLSPDERRGGGRTNRRRLTAGGLPPVGRIPHVFAWGDVDGAVAPTTGDRFVLARPSLHADTCQLPRDAFGQAGPDRVHSGLVEHRGAHTAQRLRGPEHMRCVWLPPSGPERHPSERGWRDRKAPLAWPQVTDVEAQPDAVSAL